MSIQRAGRLLILPFILAIWIGLAGVPALALAELRVPQDYKTIQEAIDAASRGDTILIDPGTYVENLRVDKEGLTIRGTDPEQVIIQAKFLDLPVVTIRERKVALLGLTLTGGQQGVKVEPRADNPTLSNLVVRSNRAEGLFVEGVRSGELSESLVTGNKTGVYIGSRATFRLQGNRIVRNEAGVELLDANRLELRQNRITENTRCGLRSDEKSELLGLDNAVFRNGTDLCGAAQGRTDLLDRTPPPAPRDLTVKPEGWTNLGRFTLDWTDPEDPAGIAAFWFKLGSEPTNPTDGIRREIEQKPLTIENPPEGEQPVFVWLEDGMGNKDHRNAAQVVIRFDKTPPTGTLRIADGAARTAELVVGLSLQAQDALSGLAEMRFSNDGSTWSAWEPFASSKPGWDLSGFGGNPDLGQKTVYAELRDRAGNVARLEARIEYIVAKPLTASFTVTPAEPRPGQPVTFDASASSSPNGKITKYAWDLGDGTKNETDRPTLQHTYAASGRYTVCLVVTDELGLTATASRELVVEQRPTTLQVPQDFFTVEEALRAAQAGDIVLLSPGLYSVNLVLEKSVTLKGAATPVTLQGKDGAKPVLTVQGSGVEVRVENLAVTASTGATAPAVSLSGGAKLIASAISVSNQGSGAALLLRGTSQATAAGIEASPLELKSEGGTAVDAGDEVRLELTDVRATGKAGIALSGKARATLTRATITATAGIGLSSGSSEALTLTTVTVTATAEGIKFTGAGALTLTSVTVTSSAEDGLVHSGTGALAASGLNVTAAKAALRVSGPAAVTLEAPVLSGYEAGIVVSGEAKLSLRGGTVSTSTQGIGVRLADQAQATLEEATITGGLLNLHIVSVGAVRILSCTLAQAEAGVLVGGPALVYLQGNTIRDHAQWGVMSPSCLPAELWGPVRTLVGHTAGVTAVALSPDGKVLASGSSDRTVRLWELATGQLLRTLSGHTAGVSSVAFSPDGKVLATGSLDKTIKLWEVATGKELRTLSGHGDRVNAVTFSPDGKTLASGSGDKTIKLWEAATGKELRTLSGHTGGVNALAFSPDGRILASGSDDKTVRLWDPATGTARTFSGHTDLVFSVTFSPDGGLLASSSYMEIQLRDPKTGSLFRTLTGHQGYIYAVAFSPDGKTLASGADDNTVKLWDVATGNIRVSLDGHTGWVRSLAFSPDGKTLASGADDQTVKVWSASALATLVGPTPEFSGTIMGSENLMVRNGTALPPELKVANQGNVCPADFLFLVKE